MNDLTAYTFFQTVIVAPDYIEKIQKFTANDSISCTTSDFWRGIEITITCAIVLKIASTMCKEMKRITNAMHSHRVKIRYGEDGAKFDSVGEQELSILKNQRT